MSHFRVLNIGNVEENMQSYNEQDEEFFQHVNRTEEFKEDYKKYNQNKKNKLVSTIKKPQVCFLF